MATRQSKSEAADNHDKGSLQITILAPGSHVAAPLEVKKSKFIGYAQQSNEWKDAQAFLEVVKQEHPKARHWCYGFRAGGGGSDSTTITPTTERSSDNGEPSGTAGAPILQAIATENVTNVMVVVVRYFGGIKLGAGGLIRSYGAAARHVLQQASRQTYVPQSHWRVQVHANDIGVVYDLGGRLDTTISDESYDAQGDLTVTLTCARHKVTELRQGLLDGTSGRVRIDDV